MIWLSYQCFPHGLQIFYTHDDFGQDFETLFDALF